MSALSPCSLQTFDNDNIETNCFGGVTTKIREMMTKKEQIKHNLLPAPAKPKIVPFSWVTSPTRAFIEKPISELNQYKPVYDLSDCFFEEEKIEEKEYVSVNKLNLQ